nr:MAG TPA: hypothetical protein [Caudoviricetes sp.]
MNVTRNILVVLKKKLRVQIRTKCKKVCHFLGGVTLL